MNTFTFNGESSLSYGLIVEYIPTEAGGRKIINSIQIPGRTGALTIDTGAFENSRKAYSVAFKGDTGRMRRVRQWLALSVGYCRLEDDYDPDVYRKARVISVPDFENIMQAYGRGTIEFDCDPRRFLKEGERAQTGPIVNDYMPSKPVVIINATGAGTVTIGDTLITIKSDPGQTIYVDSELMEVHNGSTSLASYVSMAEFPTLKNGTNNVSFTGNVSGVQVIPNFWQP